MVGRLLAHKNMLLCAITKKVCEVNQNGSLDKKEEEKREGDWERGN